MRIIIHILSHFSKIIDLLIFKTREYENFEKNYVLSTICEQLKLLILCKERYRYNFFFDTNIFILPHPKIITSICSFLLTDPTFEQKQKCLKHVNTIADITEMTLLPL